MRFCILLLLLGCASLPRPSDAPQPAEPTPEAQAVADNCMRQDDHGLGGAIVMAIERAAQHGL